MARVQETPLMAAKDIVRNLSRAGAAFRQCEWERSCTGHIKEGCRQRWETWKKALVAAENKLKELDRVTEREAE